MDCPRYTDAVQQDVDSFKHWIIGILRPTVGLVGILGNGLAPVIIMRKTMRNTFHNLLGRQTILHDHFCIWFREELKCRN